MLRKHGLSLLICVFIGAGLIGLFRSGQVSRATTAPKMPTRDEIKLAAERIGSLESKAAELEALLKEAKADFAKLDAIANEMKKLSDRASDERAITETAKKEAKSFAESTRDDTKIAKQFVADSKLNADRSETALKATQTSASIVEKTEREVRKDAESTQDNLKLVQAAAKVAESDRVIANDAAEQSKAAAAAAKEYRDRLEADLARAKSEVETLKTEMKIAHEEFEKRLLQDKQKYDRKIKPFMQQFRALCYAKIANHTIVTQPYDAMTHKNYDNSDLSARPRLGSGRVSANGDKVIIAAATDTTHVYSPVDNSESKQEIRTSLIPKAFLNSKTVTFMDQEGDICTQDVESGKVEWRTTKHIKQLPDEVGVRYAQGGSRIAVSLSSGRVVVMEKNLEIASFSLGAVPSYLVMSPDGATFAAIVNATAESAAVVVCQVDTKTRNRIAIDKQLPTVVALHSSGLVAIGYHDGRFGIFRNDATTVVTRVPTASALPIRSIALLEDSFNDLTVVTVDVESIRLYDAESGYALASIPCHGGKQPTLKGDVPKILAVGFGWQLESLTILDDLGLVYRHQLKLLPIDWPATAPLQTTAKN